MFGSRIRSLSVSVLIPAFASVLALNYSYAETFAADHVSAVAKSGVSKIWNPDLGNGRYKNPVINADYSDPDAIAVGDDIWLTASSFCNIPGLPILHSTDMVNWEIVNHALRRNLPDDFYNVPQHGKGVWAPSIRYHNGEYFIYWGDPDYGVYMVKTDNPRGEWSEPCLVWSGKGIIDACPLWDEDGRAYLVNGWAKSRSGFNSALTVSEMSADGTRMISDPVLVYDGMPDGNHTVEGPKFYKRDGFYYILAPAGGVEQGWQIALRSNHPYGPYEARTVMSQGNSAINGPHQGAWVTTAAGEDWFLNFQDRGIYGRVLHLNPMEWRGGWPVIGRDADGDGCGEPVEGGVKPLTRVSSPNVNPAESDDFNSPVLGEQWAWFANYSPEFGFPTPYGYFRLYGHRVSDSFVNVREVPNLLVQKLPGEPFKATAKVTVSGTSDGQQAGMIIMGRDYARLTVEKVGSGFSIRLIECEGADEGASEIEGEAELLPATRHNCEGPGATQDLDLYLRVRTDKKGLAYFSYSQDGKKFKEIGKPFKIRQGHWIGATIGFFALQNGKDRGWIDLQEILFESV